MMIPFSKPMALSLLTAAALLAPGAPALAEPPVFPAGTPFQLNEDKACFATAPQVAVFPDGEVWVWEEEGDLIGADVPPDGRQVAARQVLAETGGTFSHRVDQAGEIAWTAWVEREAEGFTVKLRRLAPPAGVQSPIVELAAQSPQSVDVAVAPSGHALVAWVERRPGDDPERRLVFQQVSAGGVPIDLPRVMWVSDELLGPAVTALSDTRFLVAWLDDDTDDANTIRAMVLNNAGSVEVPVFPAATAFAVSDDLGILGIPRSAPEAVALPGGGFAVSWTGTLETDPPSLHTSVRVYDETATPRGDTRVVSSPLPPEFGVRPGMAVDDSGRFAVVWAGFDPRVQSGSPPFSVVAGALLDLLGRQIGDTFLVRRVPPASDMEARNASAAFDGDGGLVVAWDEGTPVPPVLPPECTGGGHFVYGQRFTGGCAGDALCLQQDRFELTVEWDDPFNGGSGVGHPRQLTGDTGAFWFFGQDNLELMVKVLDGREINDHWWVFFGSLTNVEFTLTVRDRLTERVETYHNPPFVFASEGDTTAFPEVP